MSTADPIARFEHTRWTLVCALNAGEPQRSAALESLCQIYRPPLVQFAKDAGLGSDAEDVVQDFLTVVVRRDLFAMANRERGRMRTFLLLGLRQQIVDWRRRAGAGKRGGGAWAVPLDELGPDLEGYAATDQFSPDKVFARSWGKTLCEHAIDQMRAQWAAAGRAERFDALRPYLFRELEQNARFVVAGELGLGEGNVRVILHRFRHEFALTIRKAIADTVSNISEVDEELRELGLEMFE